MLQGEPLCRIWLGMNRYWDMICDGIKLRTCWIFTIWGSRADLSGIDTEVFPVRMTQLGLWSLHRISINWTFQLQSSHYQVRGHWYFHIRFTQFFLQQTGDSQWLWLKLSFHTGGVQSIDQCRIGITCPSARPGRSIPTRQWEPRWCPFLVSLPPLQKSLQRWVLHRLEELWTLQARELLGRRGRTSEEL